MPSNIKRVAIIGAGPSGAIALDALTKEGKFDLIRVFERNQKVGGMWVQNQNDDPKIPSLRDVIQQKADQSVPIPSHLPSFTPRDLRTNSSNHRFVETAMYENLETNIDARIMSFTQEPFPDTKSNRSIQKFGHDTPFRHREVIRSWIENFFESRGYQDHLEFNTTVELVEKVGNEWVLTLRKSPPGGKYNYWWRETFDAVIVASGHYYVPYIPDIPGLDLLEDRYSGSVEHSKAYRNPEKYRNKKVIVVGSFVSASDVILDILGYAQSPVYASVRSPHPVLGFAVFEHPHILRKPAITSISVDDGQRTVHFSDGTQVENVDTIIFGTGFVFSLPFVPALKVVNRRVPGLYLHIFKQDDPTFAIVGGVSAAFAFRVFEWQAVTVARVLAGRASLPPIEEQQKWEANRVATRGEGPSFYKLAPDWAEYFETLRKLAGEPIAGTAARALPKWDPAWIQIFEDMWQRRLASYKRDAEAADHQRETEKSREQGKSKTSVRPKL